MSSLTNRLLTAFFLISTIMCFGQSRDSSVSCYNCCRPDGHAPLGIITDHNHYRGQWSISYLYMNMSMKGNQTGTAKVEDGQIFQNYIMAPEKMTMQMHMLMVMYGVTAKLTVMGMFNYSINNMSMNMSPDAGTIMHGMNMSAWPSGQMTSASCGLSDTKLFALYKILEVKKHRVVLGMGINLPTGSMQINGTTMLGDHQRLPYNMQTGTGTFNFLPSVTYVGQSAFLSWGAAIKSSIKPFVNTEGYTWGNEFTVNSWVAWKWVDFFSNSLRVEAMSAGKITGYDKNISILMNNDPNANANNYGGEKAFVYLGMNFFKDRSFLEGHRLLFEYGIPVYQNLHGPQMSSAGVLLAGWQYRF